MVLEHDRVVRAELERGGLDALVVDDDRLRLVLGVGAERLLGRGRLADRKDDGEQGEQDPVGHGCPPCVEATGRPGARSIPARLW